MIVVIVTGLTQGAAVGLHPVRHSHAALSKHGCDPWDHRDERAPYAHSATDWYRYVVVC